ncbi:spindle and kinetochore-associated protein 3 [Colossoma macropomum]|uniref:spindle and kinetochore-associated protein 3 n=1 Tax=Colossoma macropomum TaxID=42526 RepID=UPI001864D648|nr:spindle and kinetochore-associated protein 3 [Colossoma macropomum]XP_036415104.1 spindle and kinetochore-associated protein 3 [Colossoma macropomum]XP_036415182.1 spindle and kinetochore-associated protein 3 [Colossoma macropomum]
MSTMDTSIRFFAKLRSLAVRLETERANLEQTASQKLNEEDDETESGPVRALHELHSEVRGLKRQLHGQVASQEGGSGELRSFIKACMVLKQRTTEDIERIRRHYEKYGYRPRKAFQKNSEVTGQAEAETKPIIEKQPERELAVEMAEDGEEAEVQESKTPERMPLPAVDQMRTPQLADFGLSALHLQMVLCNAELSACEVPPIPAVALSPPPPPPLVMTMQPSLPKTPRCSLVMDEDAPTPRLEDFGITEHTMCLNNDFTMDLFRKKPPRNRQTHSATEETSQRSPPNNSTPPSCIPQEKLNESMESPELPAFCTLDLKMNKQLVSSSAQPSSPHSPPHPGNAAATPELPTFETPFISKLISARKETRQDEQDGLTRSLNSMSNSSECPTVRVSSSDMPQMSASMYQTEESTPEMPKLQSFLGRSLPCMGGNKQSGITEPPPTVLHPNDDHTEDWCLATPRVRMEFQVEPRTPEMPDMSSITQDILKLVSQGNCKPLPSASVQQGSKMSLQTVAAGKENRAQVLNHVSEKEFHGLASYMKQIPLTSLNQAINKINLVVEERHRDGDSNSEAFHMEDLRKILDVGPQAPMYILSLVELKRLENVQGFGRNATFKILTNT